MNSNLNILIVERYIRYSLLKELMGLSNDIKVGVVFV